MQPNLLQGNDRFGFGCQLHSTIFVRVDEDFETGNGGIETSSRHEGPF